MAESWNMSATNKSTRQYTAVIWIFFLLFYLQVESETFPLEPEMAMSGQQMGSNIKNKDADR